MDEIVTLQLSEADSEDEVLVVVRATERRVAIALSLKGNGDLEVVLHPHDCRTVLQALQRAISVAEGE